MEARRTRRALAAQVRDQVEAFVERLEAETGPVVLYVGDDFAAKFGLPRGLARDEWVRRLFARPNRAWTVWQFHYRADVDGIAGDVDLDVFRASALTERA